MSSKEENHSEQPVKITTTTTKWERPRAPPNHGAYDRTASSHSVTNHLPPSSSTTTISTPKRRNKRPKSIISHPVTLPKRVSPIHTIIPPSSSRVLEQSQVSLAPFMQRASLPQPPLAANQNEVGKSQGGRSHETAAAAAARSGSRGTTTRTATTTRMGSTRSTNHGPKKVLPQKRPNNPQNNNNNNNNGGEDPAAHARLMKEYDSLYLTDLYKDEKETGNDNNGSNNNNNNNSNNNSSSSSSNKSIDRGNNNINNINNNNDQRNNKPSAIEPSVDSDSDDDDSGLYQPKITFGTFYLQSKETREAEQRKKQQQLQAQQEPPPAMLLLQDLVQHMEQDPRQRHFEDPHHEYQPHDYSFCCATCRCQFPGNVPKPSSDPSNSIWGMDQKTLHRKCCHGLAYNCKPASKDDDDVISSVGDKLNYNQFQTTVRISETKYFQEGIQHKVVLQQWAALKKECDQQQLPDAVSIAMTSVHHQANLRFHERQLLQSQQQAKHNGGEGLVVVDFFAGVGTGLLALQKNGIKIKTYIFVEFDPVPVHVLKYNHSRTYRQNIGQDDDRLPDVRLVHINRFEDVDSAEKIAHVLKEHGPIDLVLGSPECQDYTRVNAKRQGVAGLKGGYHRKLGHLIQSLKTHPSQQGKHFYFLVENVPARGDDKKILEEAYGVPTVDIDAANFSPTNRLRSFHTNLPLYKDILTDVYGEESDAKSCLEEGYRLPGDFIDGITDDHSGGKALTFMASKSRMDHNRMKVVREEPAGSRCYRARPMNLVERERMMGYYDHYVGRPLRLLYDEIVTALKCHCLPVTQDNKNVNYKWSKHLSVEYHCFSGLHYSIDKDYGDLKISPPPSHLTYTGKKSGVLEIQAPSLSFDEQEYGKHLIGNAYSVRVVELLLQPLQKVFESGDDYKGFNYEYYWKDKAFRNKHNN